MLYTFVLYGYDIAFIVIEFVNYNDTFKLNGLPLPVLAAIG